MTIDNHSRQASAMKACFLYADEVGAHDKAIVDTIRTMTRKGALSWTRVL